MSEELNPCPFCGGGNISIDTAVADTYRYGYGVTCLTDGCMGNIYRHDSAYLTEELAIEAWNTRHTTQSQVDEYLAKKGLVAFPVELKMNLAMRTVRQTCNVYDLTDVMKVYSALIKAAEGD